MLRSTSTPQWRNDVFPSMQDHWRAGYYDAVRTLRHPEVFERPRSRDGVFIFDLHRDGRE